MIEELHRYKSEYQIDGAVLLDRNSKMVAFNFARQSNHPTFIKMMAHTYELPHAKDMFIEKIREIINEHNYKDVRCKQLNSMNVDMEASTLFRLSHNLTCFLLKIWTK